MIVEDEPLIREGLKQYFDWKMLGVHTIIEAENGQQGVDLALVEQPHLVITDIRMPVMDGLEMIGQLRPLLPYTRFIILSGYNEFEYAKKAIHYGGVHDYLLKPLQYDDSLAVIVDVLDKIQSMQQEGTIPKQQNDQHSLIDQQDPDLLLFAQIEAFIKVNMDQDLSLNRVAEHFFYNPSYLSRLFKTKLNKNYVAFVSEIRIQHAKQCLEIAKYSVIDISTMCGYRSYKHFVKVFKSVTQMTPTDYRKQLRS